MEIGSHWLSFTLAHIGSNKLFIHVSRIWALILNIHLFHNVVGNKDHVDELASHHKIVAAIHISYQLHRPMEDDNMFVCLCVFSNSRKCNSILPVWWWWQHTSSGWNGYFLYFAWFHSFIWHFWWTWELKCEFDDTEEVYIGIVHREVHKDNPKKKINIESFLHF